MKVNISIDDVSPHPFSSVRVLERCEELIELFPRIKFSLFIPVAYWRTVKPGTTTRSPLYLSEYTEFCEKLLDLNPENYEIGYHGFFHGIPGKSDNDEFQTIDYNQTIERINNMRSEVGSAGLSNIFKNMFRPPAWRMNPNAFQAFHDSGFELFALTNLDYALETYGDSVNKYNCSFSNQFPPFRELKKEQNCGIVYHACEWDKNFLDSDKVDSLANFLNSVEEKEFVFLEGLV